MTARAASDARRRRAGDDGRGRRAGDDGRRSRAADEVLVATTVLDGIARERGDGGGDADGRGEQQREPSGDGTADATGGVGVGVDAAGARGRRAERGGIDTPGHFAFATPMSARVCEEGMTTPRTPTLANDSPDRARLDELLAAPVKPNFGTRAAIECTPRHTPLKLRFDDNVDVVVSGTNATSKKRARGKLSDVFKATKSTTPRLTRARKAML